MRPSILFHISTRNKESLLEEGEMPEEWKIIYYKRYPRLPQIALPRPDKINVPLSQALLARKSERDFDPEKTLWLQRISDFLYWSAGIKDKKSNIAKRMYPSGGARYPIEIYPIIFRAGDFKNGVYHYAPREHLLEEIADKDWLEEARKILVDKEIKNAAAVFIMTAVFERTMMKYQEFGYRLILEEAGHLCQNFYLVSGAMGLAGCGLGGFYDKPANELLDIDGINEAAIYAFALGNKNA